MGQLLVDLGVSLILVLGISQFRTPRGARVGNWTAAFALACAVAIVLARHSVAAFPLVLAAGGVGIAAGCLLAVRVRMIQIPAMVAFQHGMGGVAAFLVSFVELLSQAGRSQTPLTEVSALLGLCIGTATFSGSMIASGKLAGRIRQTPVVLAGHNAIFAALSVTCVLLMLGAGLAERAAVVATVSILIFAAAVVWGVIFSIRIGGADMPVLISFLNATAGLAAALCGVAIRNQLLIVCGATVAASGSILTHVMCRAMNRSLATVFAGLGPPSTTTKAEPIPRDQPAGAPSACLEPPVPAAPPQSETGDPLSRAIEAARSAQSVIIVPGYGMALAEAQEETVRLAERLVSLGKTVLFAIHPVAGRMPGHMHVLLAEAEVDYGMIRELKDVNSQFAQTDLALIVGACDVVNPAAIQSAGTPISGMPILRAHEARKVIVCNLDDRPGYSGVENTLYGQPHAILLLGDAKETLSRLLQDLG
jgi:NAD/NADP transhydrogenase beta subunit